METSCEKQNIFRILHEVKNGSSRELDILCADLLSPNLRSVDLLELLKCLKECVTLLDTEYEALLGCVFKISWADGPQTVVLAYQTFLINLVSAQNCYLKPCLRMLISIFKPQIKNSKDPSVQLVESSEVDMKKHEEMSINAHTVLKHILQLVPLSKNVFMLLIQESYPHVNKPLHLLRCYMRNLLNVTFYLPNKRQKILELIVDRLLSLDVKCTRYAIEEAEENTDTFIMEVEETLSCHGIQPMAHGCAHKLDLLLNDFFLYINSVCFENEAFNWEATRLLFREMLLVFDRIILTTVASSHVQFIMLYICSFKPILNEGFLDYLWKKVKDPNVEIVYRQMSVSYIASFLARANYIDISTVETSLSLICKWLHKYLDLSEHSTHPDINRHRTFYSTCQSVFYVLSFRSKELFETRKGQKWGERLNLQRLITSKINPLKYCLPVITKTFSSVGRAHQFAFCDTVIERNKRNQLPFVSNSSHSTEIVKAMESLESWFPFDPYLLKQSSAFIQPLYREYSGSVGEDSDMEDDGSSSTTSSSDAENDMENSGRTLLTEEFYNDFMNYSTSPGFKMT